MVPGVRSSRETAEASIESLAARLYADHDGLAAETEDLIRSAGEAGDQRTADLARLLRADLDNRGGRVPQGVAEAQRLLTTSHDRLVRAHAHAVVAGGLWRIGDNGEALRHAFSASRMTTEEDPPALRVDHAIIHALQVNDQRIGALSHQEFEVAQDLAEATGRPALVLANLNNWAWCSYAHDELDAATDLMERMRAYSATTGEPLNASCADTVARILLETGHSQEAVAVAEAAIDGAAPTDSDAVAGALLTLAEIQHRGGDTPAAVLTLTRCRETAERDGIPDTGALALRMLADCHAGLGDFRTAYQEMVDFHELWTVRRSEKSEVMARVAQAQFAVDEARRTTEEFREMAERDALTGLWNRRRSDAELAALLGTAANLEPASVAILDLDHFKQINDTWSHATGDEVLRRLAEILRAVPGHAGRHGGEEFILILPGDPAVAVQTCEQVRQSLRAYAWESIAAGLTVTTSIGVTALRPDDDALTVVRRADDLLYAAKRGGRDRVTAG
jgi:diguanylate cyclase (GGDEF)-like protein